MWWLRRHGRTAEVTDDFWVREVSLSVTAATTRGEAA